MANIGSRARKAHTGTLHEFQYRAALLRGVAADIDKACEPPHDFDSIQAKARQCRDLMTKARKIAGGADKAFEAYAKSKHQHWLLTREWALTKVFKLLKEGTLSLAHVPPVHRKLWERHLLQAHRWPCAACLESWATAAKTPSSGHSENYSHGWAALPGRSRRRSAMPKLGRYGIKGLQRKKDGTWFIDLRWREPITGEHRRHQDSIGKVSAAAKAHAQSILEVALAGGWDPKKPAAIRLESALSKFREERDAHCGAAQNLKREKACAKFLAAWGNIDPAQLTRDHVEKYIRTRMKEVSPASVNREVEIAGNFFKVAAEKGWIPWDLLHELKSVEHLKEPPPRVRSLTAAEERKLVEALATTGIRPIVACALLSGMREDEVCSLRKSQVDLDRGAITLGKNKTNVRRAPIPINAPLKEVLEEAMKDPPNDTEWVFITTKQKKQRRPYTTAGMRAVWHRAIHRAKITDFRFHDLRHTFATRMREHETGIDAIALLLGHTSVKMASKYAHVGSATLKAAVANLPALAPAPLPKPEIPPLHTKGGLHGRQGRGLPALRRPRCAPHRGEMVGLSGRRRPGWRNRYSDFPMPELGLPQVRLRPALVAGLWPRAG